MSKKAYSEQERKQVGQDLLSVGLEMLSQRGLKGTKLQDILQAVGISKPFFYGNYYASLAELVLHIIDYEISLLLETVRDDIAKRDAPVEDRINHFLKMMIDSRQHHFFVMTQEEEVLVSKHLTPEELEAFQKGQAACYGELLSLWHIPEEKCTPKELGNLILSVVLIYNSAARSLPFFLPGGIRTDGSGPEPPPFPDIWPRWRTAVTSGSASYEPMRCFLYGQACFS
ncbi:MAG: TetR/AcrR family transcriptional regulator [[Clostridium] symbiosum]